MRLRYRKVTFVFSKKQEIFKIYFFEIYFLTVNG